MAEGAETDSRGSVSSGETAESTSLVDPGLRAAPPASVRSAMSRGEADSAGPGYVYALGRIEPRFPSASVEREFAQVAGRSETAGMTDRQVLHSLLSQRENRYLVRQLCWVMSVEGLEAYILVPSDPVDFDLLAQTVRPSPAPTDLDVVIGRRGPIAPPHHCNGLAVPIVPFDQIYSFDRDSFINSIPRPENAVPEEFAAAAAEVFDRVIQIADNVGYTPEHRALTYLAVRYPAIYAAAAAAFGRGESLTAVNASRSDLTGSREIVNVIFSFTDRTTDVVARQFTRVDVTDEFPFLVSKLSPYVAH
jgi:PatG Domain